MLTGTLIAITDSSLTLETAKTKNPSVVSRLSLTRFEISRGKHSAAGWGAAAGAVALGAGAFPSWQSCGSCKGSAPAAFVIGYGVIGAGLGAGIGALIKRERWEEIPAGRVQIGVAPMARRGLAARVVLTF